MKKRFLSVFLVLAMMLSLVPAMSFAASVAEPITYIERTWDGEKVVETEKDCTDYIFIDENTTELGYGKWYVAEGNFTNFNRIKVTGTANLILTDGCNFNVNGISVEQGQDLHIYGQSQDSGKLYAASEYYSGIGAKYAGASINPSRVGNVTIHGGNVSAMGGQSSAGIGASERGYGGNVTILGGTVNATGGNNAAGIGGGSGGDGGTVNIYGGNVTAAGVTGIGAGAAGKDHGTLTVAENAVIKAGDFAPGAEVTADEYIQNGNKYVNITFPEQEPLEPVKYIERSWNGEKVLETEKECTDYILVDENTTAFEDGEWYVINTVIVSEIRIEITGTANVILCDGCGIISSGGFSLTEGNTLNIYGQKEGTGFFTAGVDNLTNAAIGGQEMLNGGTVNIYGGMIKAEGYIGSMGNGAGIGGGKGGNGGNVTVYGGTVDAESDTGAGIGGGMGGNGGNLTVYGGTVTAFGYGGGIGAGYNGTNNGTLTLAPNAEIHAGDHKPGAEVTADEYIQNRNKYVSIIFPVPEPEPLEPVSYIDRSWDGKTVVETEMECEDFIVIDENTATFENDKWYVVKGNVTNNNRIVVNGTANIILVDGRTLTLTKGIYNGMDKSLNIYTQSGDSGKLIASGEENNAAIGGNDYHMGGEVKIYGGSIEVTGGKNGAGIGGGRFGDSGPITIYGGTITAIGGNKAAAIGGGYGGRGKAFTMYGGTVNATGGENGAGIGGGYNGEGCYVIIYGGTVNAVGGSEAAGIGSGRKGESDEISSNHSVTIYGGTVNATGGENGAGIGGGSYVHGGTVDIYGGTVTATGTEYGSGIGGGHGANGEICNVYGGIVTVTSGGYGRAIGAGYQGSSDGIVTAANGMIVKSGDAAPGTPMPLSEYVKRGYKYCYIGDNTIAKGKNWYIDFDGTLYLIGPVENTSTNEDKTPWKEYKSQIKSVVAEEWAKVSNCARLFSNCENLESVDLQHLSVNGMTDMQYMFSGCSKLESVDLSNIETQLVTNMRCMFYNATALKSVKFSSFIDTTAVTDMRYMFRNCSSLESLDLSRFKTPNLKEINTIFYDCTNLKSLDISNLNCDKVEDAEFILGRCNSIEEITISRSALQKFAGALMGMNSVWYNKDDGTEYHSEAELKKILGKVTLIKELHNIDERSNWYLDGKYCLHITGDITSITTENPCDYLVYSDRIRTVKAESGSRLIAALGMFNKCSKLTSVDLTETDTTYLKTTNLMFKDCKSLKYVNISGWDEAQVFMLKNMFEGCSSLEVLDMTGIGFFPDSSLYFDGFLNDCTSLREIHISSNALQHITDQLISIAPSWRNAENGTVYNSVDDLNAITGDVVLIRNCDHVWAEATCISPKKCTICGLTDGDIVEDAHNWVPANCALPKYCTICGLSEGGIDPDTHVWGATAEKKVKVCEKCGFIEGDGWNIPDGTTLNIFGDIHNEDGSIPWHDYRMKITAVKTFDGAKIESGKSLFDEFKNLTDADLTKLDTSACTSMREMFRYDEKLTKLDLSGFNTSNVKDMSGFLALCKLISDLDISNFETGKVTDMSMMFYECESLPELDISHFDFTNVASMEAMFEYDINLADIDFGAFRAEKVTNTMLMFSACKALKSIDFGEFNTSKITNMYSMFNGCISLTELDLSSFNTSAVNDFSFMFGHCTGLTELDLGNFNTTSATNMTAMFMGCSSLTSLNISSFRTNSVEFMDNMFRACSALTELDLSHFETPALKDVHMMFMDCTNLKKLNISSWNCDKVRDPSSSTADTINAFNNCTSLEEIRANGSVMKKLAKVIAQTNSVWYNKDNGTKYDGEAQLKGIGDNVTLVKSVPFLFDSVSLVLSGELGLNFYTVINDAEAVKDGYMLFEIGNKVETQAVYFTDAVLVGERYLFTCNVNALQMADAITVSFHYGDVTVGPKTTSVASYIDKIIENHNNDDTDPTVKLAKAIINYGHYAQLAQAETRDFTLKTDYAVTDNLSDVTIANTSDLEAYKATKTGSIDGITKVSRSLSLDHGTDINLYLTVAEAYEPTVNVADKNGNKVEFTLEKTGSRYLLIIPQIAAHQLGDMYTVSIDSGAMTVKVSALSYAYSVLNSEKTNAQKLCVSALYEYYNAAITYRNTQ